MPDPQTPEQPSTVVVSAPTGTAQEQARQEVYNQYTQLYTQQASEPVVEAPAEVVEPAVVAAPEPTMAQMFAQQQAMIESLKTKLDSFTAPPAALTTAPVTPVGPVTPAKANMEQWVNFMSAGEYDKAEEFLLEIVAPKLQARMQPQIVQQSVEAGNAEREITNFITQFKVDNADIGHMERYISNAVESRLQTSYSEGKITKPADLVREYKAAVTDETKQLRDTLQLSRAAGREDVRTTRREVLSATTMEPTGVQQPAEARPAGPATASDYISQRRERMATYQGLR